MIGEYIRQYIRQLYETFMLPDSDIRITQLNMAAQMVIPPGHQAEAFGTRSGLWYWVKDRTTGMQLIDTKGPYAYEGALHGLTAMATAAKSERQEET